MRRKYDSWLLTWGTENYPWGFKLLNKMDNHMKSFKEKDLN